MDFEEIKSDLRQEKKESLFLRPESEVLIMDKHVQKKMSLDEIKAYETLEEYREVLKDESIEIIIPKIISYDKDRQIGIIEKLKGFSDIPPADYFGRTSLFNQFYFNAFLRAAEIIRTTIRNENVSNKFDYEIGEKEDIPSLQYIKKASITLGKEVKRMDGLYEEIEDMVYKTQQVIMGMELKASHRDPNPNNYHIYTSGGKIKVSIIDWATFGLARRGFEEGRFFSYLALSKEKQNIYLDIIKEKSWTKEEVLYFWRVVIMRAYKEIASMLCGYYDDRLNKSISNQNQENRSRKLKNEIINALYETIGNGLKQIKL